MNASGEATPVEVETALWFYPKGTLPKFRAMMSAFGYAKALRDRHSPGPGFADRGLHDAARARDRPQFPAAHALPRQGVHDADVSSSAGLSTGWPATTLNPDSAEPDGGSVQHVRCHHRRGQGLTRDPAWRAGLESCHRRFGYVHLGDLIGWRARSALVKSDRQQRAPRHDRLRLVERGGHDAAAFMDQSGDQRDPARTADQEDAGQLGRARPASRIVRSVSSAARRSGPRPDAPNRSGSRARPGTAAGTGCRCSCAGTTFPWHHAHPGGSPGVACGRRLPALDQSAPGVRIGLLDTRPPTWSKQPWSMSAPPNVGSPLRGQHPVTATGGRAHHAHVDGAAAEIQHGQCGCGTRTPRASRRKLAAWNTAAATGSATSAIRPARPLAACRNTRVRAPPQSAGWVSTSWSTAAPPATRRASATARVSTARTTSRTPTTVLPSSNSGSSMRRLGVGSKRDGSIAAWRVGLLPDEQRALRTPRTPPRTSAGRRPPRPTWAHARAPTRRCRYSTCRSRPRSEPLPNRADPGEQQPRRPPGR